MSFEQFAKIAVGTPASCRQWTFLSVQAKFIIFKVSFNF